MVDNDRLDPQHSALGCMLLDSNLIGSAVQQLDDSDFTSAPCRLVWQAMTRLWRSGAEIDPVIIRKELAGFDNATAFLVELMDVTPTTANFNHYLRLMKEQAALDSLREIGEALMGVQRMEDAAPLLAKANAVTVRKKDRPRMGVDEMLRSFAEDHATAKEPEYIPWILGKLQNKLYAELGDMVIIAGRPSDGKTSFALANAWHQAQKYRVGFYSLETGCKKIRDRSIAQQVGIDLGRIKHNAISDPEWQLFGMAAGQLPGRELEIIEAAGMTVDEIFADAVASRFQVIYVDYMQIIRASNPREINRTNIVADISVRMHQLSRSTGILTVALAQVSRAAVENGKPRMPQLTDLKESGQIEQDADAVMFIWRKETERNDSQRGLFVAKNKEGEIGCFDLHMQGNLQQFAECVPEPQPGAAPGWDKNCPF